MSTFSGKITIQEALQLIDSDECISFDVHCTIEANGRKFPVYYSETLEDDPCNNIEKWIKETDNYGSFFMTAETTNGHKTYQIIEP